MSKNMQDSTQEFLSYLDDWQKMLPQMTLAEMAPNAAHTAVAVIDMTEGFCHTGALSSPRVAAIIDPIAHLLKEAWQHGIKSMILAQDNHDPEAVEFAAFPPHCVRGSAETQTVEAIRALPFYDRMMMVPKNSLSSFMNTDLSSWMDKHPEIDTFIIVGDCTDLCVYLFAMHLRVDANARGLNRRIIVPANAVATYDRPVEAARSQGGLPHDGDLIHQVFLYHMALNAVEVVEAKLQR